MPRAIQKEKERKKEWRRESLEVHPEVRRGLLALALLTAAALLGLSFFDFAGPLGAYLERGLALLVGVTRFALPFLLVLMAYLTERAHNKEYRSTHFIGGFIFVLAINGLVHLRAPYEEYLVQARAGAYGGFAGYVAAAPLTSLLGKPTAVVVLGALLISSFLFLFNTSLFTLLSKTRVTRSLGHLGRALLAFLSFVTRRRAQIYYHETPEPAFSRASLIGAEADVPAGKDIRVSATSSEEETTPPSLPSAVGPLLVKPKKRSLPPFDLLEKGGRGPHAGDVKANMEIIEKTLANFSIPVEMGEIRVGPTVTQYTLRPAEGIKLSRITALSNDLALALAAHPIRIEAPIPGRALVGIEVPNQKAAIVTLRDLLESDEFKTREHPLMIALGKDVAGKPWFGSLPQMPHLLVAGATGSGKTVYINALVLSLLYAYTPDEIKFIMVDPKRVELPLYNGIPHLLTPVITEVPKTVNALKWCISEMERRFDLLSKAGARDIFSYNRKAEEQKNGGRLPGIVFVVDELADLMVAAGAEIESGVIRLAQMARAVGIHLVLATQRPSVDVITGLIKANIPARIAFSVASLTDSRTILDGSGAEKLLGRGDMLYLAPELSKPKRLQGAYVGEDEIKRVVDFFKRDEPPEYNLEVVERPRQTNIFGESVDDFGDPLFGEAKELVIRSGKASASYLQRRLKVGYARAARLIDLLEEKGIVGPGEGAKPREVLVKGVAYGTVEDLEEKEGVDNDEDGLKDF